MTLQSRWSIKRKSVWAVVVTPVLVLGGLAAFAVTPAAAAKTPAVHAHALSAKSEHFTVKPDKAANDLDCNGWSNTYAALVPGHRMLCTDPHGPLVRSTGYYGGANGRSSLAHYTRFTDNGHYVGHDEPSVKFISNSANSGNTMSYFMKLPVDPAKAPTANGSVTHYSELSVAPWFGLPICDPGSYPQNPCTPDSDSNIGNINDPHDAGSAFMELQFYAPGEPPFAEADSCSSTKWCAAITIDSLESQFNFVNINPGCEEPVNFAFLQTNGVPTGPPGPQTANFQTFIPNANTLQMNPGDTIKLAITDPPSGLTATINDITTGQTGTMQASAANGFMNTNYINCEGSPFTFHAEYATANQQNSVPWAALDGGVLMQTEIGHGESCASLKNRQPLTEGGISTNPNTFSQDNDIFETCVGGNEGTHRGRHHRVIQNVGEGPCNASTGICKNSETEGKHHPVACPVKNFETGELCEFSDGICLPKGNRSVDLGGSTVTEHSPLNICFQDRYENGDLDYNGLGYRNNTWPNGSKNTPTSFRYVGPFDAAGSTYPLAEWETDAAGSEILCNISTGANCQVPPRGSAGFYPFWTMTNKQTISGFPAGTCTWNFGNDIKGVTTVNFGKDAEYGLPEISRYGGTIASAVFENPETTTQLGCSSSITEPSG
jgi:hypothetical protein